MKFSIRDLLWLILVVCLILAARQLTPPETVSCPCCHSMYEYDFWRQVLR